MRRSNELRSGDEAVIRADGSVWILEWHDRVVRDLGLALVRLGGKLAGRDFIGDAAGWPLECRTSAAPAETITMTSTFRSPRCVRPEDPEA